MNERFVKPSVIVAIAMVLGVVATSGGRCLAQPAEPKYSSWSRIETATETNEYKERLKEASSLDQASQAFLVGQALPQLAREENRPNIERVRRRIRERLLTEIGNNQVLGAANGVVATFMEALARDNAADPVVRVNAAILIGELRAGVRAGDGKPWPDGAARLAALAGDPKGLPAVRAAAMGGLAKYGPALGENPQLANAVGTAVMAILAENPVGGTAAARPEREWLVGRAAGLLPMLASEYPQGVAEPLARIVTDESRSIDSRVRAAAALGAGVGQKSQVDAAAIVAAIEAMAVRMLGDDVAAATKHRLEEEYRRMVAGGGGAGRGPGGVARVVGTVGEESSPSSIPEQVIRREAWRLVTLAGALDGGDGSMRPGGGIAGAAQGPVAEKAKAVAAKLREAGLALDADPAEATLVATLDALRGADGGPQPSAPTTPQAPADRPDGDNKPAAPARPAAPDTDPSSSPFGSNPFG